MKQSRPCSLQPSSEGHFWESSPLSPSYEYLNCACCGVVVGGGVLASYLYIREYPSSLAPVSYGDGALLGLLTGALGSVAYALVKIPLRYVQIKLGLTLAGIGEVETALNDPNIPEPLREIFREVLQGGLPTFIEIVFFLVTAAAFATLGGILGVAMFQKKPPPVSPSAPSPEPPAGAVSPPPQSPPSSL